MSGVCPVPAEKTTTSFEGTATVSPPDARFNTCDPATNVNVVDPSCVETEVCCPSPGPPGPLGPAGDCGEGLDYVGAWSKGTVYQAVNVPLVCSADLVLHNEDLYYCIADHLSGGSPDDTEPGVGADWETYWELFLPGTSGKVKEWTDGECYTAGELVEYDGCIYSVDEDYCADEDDINTIPDFNLDGGFYHTLISCPEEASWLEQLLDGMNPWIKDLLNWGLEQLLGTFLAETVLDGGDVTTEFNDDGGNVDQNYNGTETGAAGTAPYLPDVLERLCELVNVTNHDTSLISNIEVNMILDTIVRASDTIEMLTLVYDFGVIDIGTLKFIPHTPVSPVKTLTFYDDLGYVAEGTDPPPPYTVKRLQAFDLPREVNLTYSHRDNVHEKMVETATLETFIDGTIKNLEIPLTLTSDEAREIVERILVLSHVGRTTYSFTSSYKNIELEPEDVITVEELGDVRILRVEENIEGGLLTFTAVNAANNDFHSTVSSISSASPPPYTETPKLIGKSSAIVAELPPLSPLETNKLRLSLAVHGYAKDGWPGADLYYSTDGTNYTEFRSVSKEASWGRVQTAAPSISDWYVFDETSTITVDMKTGTLSSATELEVLNGKNLCLIGQELLGFKNVNDLGGGSYEISGLLRGQYGTEQHISTHSNNEVFVLLDEDVIDFEVDASEIGKTYYFKAVTEGSALSSATAVSYTLNGKSRRPWPVANLAATRGDAPNQAWTISWEARNQFDPEWEDSQTTDLPDMFGGFVLNILGTGSPVPILRTVTQQTTSFVYTEAMQQADFGGSPGLQSSITIDIAQIDRIVGLGYNTTQTFTD